MWGCKKKPEYTLGSIEAEIREAASVVHKVVREYADYLSRDESYMILIAQIGYLNVRHKDSEHSLKALSEALALMIDKNKLQ